MKTVLFCSTALAPEAVNSTAAATAEVEEAVVAVEEEKKHAVELSLTLPFVDRCLWCHQEDCGLAH